MKFIYPVALFISIIFSSCYSQEEKDTILIKKFIENVILVKNENPKIWNEYLHLNNSLEKEEDEVQNKIIKQHIYSISDSIIKADNIYDVIPYNEISSYSIESDIVYHNYSKVYLLVINKKVITPIIIEDDKIISFFYALRKHKDKSSPVLLSGRKN